MLFISAIVVAVAVPTGAASLAYALSCAAPRTTATLELESITIDDEPVALPEAPPPTELLLYYGDYQELSWVEADGSHYMPLDDGRGE